MGKKRRSARVSLSGIVGVGDERNTSNLEGQIDLIIPLVLLLSLLLVFRTGTTGLINLGDSLFPFFPQENFERLLYVWDSHNVLGQENPLRVTQIPWYGLAALLERVGAPLWVINRLWFALPFFLLGLSMYFLSGVIFGKKKKALRFIATLFFMFNPFTLNLIAGSNILTLSFASGVFVFGLFVCGLERKLAGFKDVILLGLVSIFVAANLVVLVLIVLLCASYLFFFLLVHRKDSLRIRHALLYSSFFILYPLLVNSWWLIPFSYQFLQSGQLQSLYSPGSDVSVLEFGVEHTSLFDVSRLFYSYTPTYFFPISNYYHYLLSPTMMSVLVLLIFSVSLFKKKPKFEIFFLVLAWVSVILASGTRPPFGFVYQFLWDHIPYFHIFRTTIRFNLWTMISYAILLGFLYQRIQALVLNGKRESLTIPKLTKYCSSFNLSTPTQDFFATYSLVFILISILLSAWPLLSGDIYGQLKPHQIPKDYYDLREFLQKQEGDFRVMVFPRADWLVAYSWSAPFDMQEILTDFSPKDTVVNPVGYLQDLEKRKLRDDDPLYAVSYYIFGKFKEDSRLDLQKAMGGLQLMGVKYLVLHHDYVYVYKDYPAVYTKPLEDTFTETEGISFWQSFGDLDVYEVENPAPRIYARAVQEGAVSPETKFTRISPVEYRVAIKGAESSYYLVFGESFNAGWRLDGKKPEGSLGRGFGNVWQLNKTGDYEIVLTYWPQRLLRFGLIVTALSLIGGAFVLIFKKK